MLNEKNVCAALLGKLNAPESISQYDEGFLHSSHIDLVIGMSMVDFANEKRRHNI